MRYHPWRHARELGLTIEFVPNLIPRATYCAGLIQIREGLRQRERRTALAHEIVHYQRRDEGVSCSRWHLAKLERHVHLIAARRLLTVDDIADAIHDPHPAAAAWVDDYTWALRLARLDPIETAELRTPPGRRLESGMTRSGISSGMKSAGLSDEDRALLDFAGLRWRRAGHQAAAIEEEFGMTVTRFWQRVNALLDDPEALAYAPATVNRLRRLRVGRRR